MALSNQEVLLSPSTVITDQELQRRSQCSLYHPTEIDLLEKPSRLTFRWALRERHLGKPCSLVDLRAHWVAGWTKGWGSEKKNSIYWKSVKRAAPFAARVYKFLLDYEVLHPYEPYILELDRGQVKGENALVLWRKYRKGEIPMLVDPLLRRPRYVKTPNYTVLAQWLAARQKVETVELGIAHLPMLFGQPWLTKDVNEVLAKQWLNHLVAEAADKRDFPRTGPQCKTCSQPCSAVFTGPVGVVE
jgi:hypothetical protein